MTTPAETFQKASFDGKAFPMLRVSVKGGLRHYVHEFPHSPGGEVEKMGRKLYEVTMTAFFHDVPESILAKEYPDLYPATLFSLQRSFEEEKTGPLVIPNLGTIQATATEWRRTFDYSGPLSGEAVELTFLEDQDRDAIFENADLGRGDLERKNFQLMALMGTLSPKLPSVFQALNDAVGAVLAIQGAADAFSKVLEAKLQQVVSLCDQADKLALLQAPENHVVLAALKDLWLTTVELTEDLLGRRSPIHVFTVPSMMSTTQISAAIFGAGDRAIDILQMNPIEDAFAVPPGTSIRYYRED